MTANDIIAVSSILTPLIAVAGLVVNARKIERVHGLVNATASRAEVRIDQLQETLVQADVKIPPRPIHPAGGSV